MNSLRVLLLAAVLLVGCSPEDHECPAPVTPSWLGEGSGTVLLSGSITAIQQCSGGYCSDGKTIASAKILEILADCAKVPGKGNLKAGDSVPIDLKGYAGFQISDAVTLGCTVYSSCADGCKKGPNELPYGPCWDNEFGCRTRCLVSSLTKAQ